MKAKPDPELLIRMLIVGYAYGIRSERRLCEEVKLSLAYRWFCRLGIEDATPDHSTYSVNRHGRFQQSSAFRHRFETVLRRAMRAGLVGGEGFAVDAGQVLADASRDRRVDAAEAPDWSGPKLSTRPVRGYRAALDRVVGVIEPHDGAFSDIDRRWNGSEAVSARPVRRLDLDDDLRDLTLRVESHCRPGDRHGHRGQRH